MKEITEKINELAKLVKAEKMFLYRNEVRVSGWVVKEPIYSTYHGKPKCSFIIYNLAEDKHTDSFRCFTQNEELIEEIKNQKLVFGIVALAKLYIFRDFTSALEIIDAKLSYRIRGMELVKRENNENDKD